MASAAAAGLEVTGQQAGGELGSTGTHSQSSFPRCPWGRGRRGDAHLQGRRGSYVGTAQQEVFSQERPCHPLLDTGAPDCCEGSQAPSPP